MSIGDRKFFPPFFLGTLANLQSPPTQPLSHPQRHKKRKNRNPTANLNPLTVHVENTERTLYPTNSSSFSVQQSQTHHARHLSCSKCTKSRSCLLFLPQTSWFSLHLRPAVVVPHNTTHRSNTNKRLAQEDRTLPCAASVFLLLLLSVLLLLQEGIPALYPPLSLPLLHRLCRSAPPRSITITILHISFFPPH